MAPGVAGAYAYAYVYAYLLLFYPSPPWWYGGWQLPPPVAKRHGGSAGSANLWQGLGTGEGSVTPGIKQGHGRHGSRCGRLLGLEIKGLVDLRGYALMHY